MHAHSSYLIRVSGTKKEIDSISQVLSESFSDETIVIPEPVANTTDYSLVVGINETYQVVLLENITEMAEKMAEAAKGSFFSIDGTIDTSESAGEYMDFSITYESKTIEVRSSAWYCIIGENTTYEEFCEWYDDEEDGHKFSLEEFENGNYYLERGPGEIVAEVPLDDVDIIELEPEKRKDTGDNESVSKKEVYAFLKKAQETALPLEEIEAFLLSISWSQYQDVVKELMAEVVLRQSHEICSEAIANEADDENPDLLWKTEDISKKNVRITQYKGNQSIVIVPGIIGGKTVTEIGENALSPEQFRVKKDIKEGRKNITKVLIPNSVKKLGKGVFKRLLNLETVVLPEKLKMLPDEAFLECESLKYVVVPDSVTRIGGNVFAGCKSLLMAYMPDSIKKARWYDQPVWPDSVCTFNGCYSLKKAKMPAGLKNVSWNDFAGCKELEEVILPTELIKVGTSAFWGCSKLSEINLPETLQRIEHEAFANCRSLTDLIIPASVVKIDETSFEKSKNVVLHLQEDSPIIEQVKKYKISYVID